MSTKVEISINGKFAFYYDLATDDTDSGVIELLKEVIEEAIADCLDNHGWVDLENRPGCYFCSGSGEGMYDGTTCYNCKGKGVEPLPEGVS